MAPTPCKDDYDKEMFPIMGLAQMRSLLVSEDKELPQFDKTKTRAELLEVVKERAMLPYYEQHLCPGALGPPDVALVAELKKKNEEELKGIDEKIADAKENLGDIEVRDALLAKATFFNRVGDKDLAVEAYKEAFEKTVGVGGRLDNILTVIRVAFFFEDKELAKTNIERAKAELKKGGDWERRNKLKVYEGIYLMITRDWKAAAELFLNVIPTFTAVELVDFKDFVLYTVLLSMVALDRKMIREQVVKSPEVLTAVKETPHLQEFLEDYYYCRYKTFNEHFVHVIDHVRADRYLSKHLRHFMRIMRLNAYRQFLASYRSVTIEAMAEAFGVSVAFIDTELSSFISSGKLTCKIDKVGGTIESNEPDSRSQVYVEIIKQGDLLLNRMQKLSGAMDM